LASLGSALALTVLQACGERVPPYNVLLDVERFANEHQHSTS
jgi:hypothetical protein